VPDLEVLQDEPEEVAGKKANARVEPANPASQPPSQAYVPPDPKNDKALRKAVELLQNPPQRRGAAK